MAEAEALDAAANLAGVLKPREGLDLHTGGIRISNAVHPAFDLVGPEGPQVLLDSPGPDRLQVGVSKLMRFGPPATPLPVAASGERSAADAIAALDAAGDLVGILRRHATGAHRLRPNFRGVG